MLPVVWSEARAETAVTVTAGKMILFMFVFRVVFLFSNYEWRRQPNSAATHPQPEP